MADANNDNQQAIILNSVENPVIADSDSEILFGSFEFSGTFGARIAFQAVNGGPKALE